MNDQSNFNLQMDVSMKTAPVLGLIIVCLFTVPATAATIRIPADQPTIQAGIDAAAAGDTVLVADGTWTGGGNQNIDFKGKAITVRSENGPADCTIDCAEAGRYAFRGFLFTNGEGPDSLLQGFRIINGVVYGTWDAKGGGIYVSGASPRIEDCIIESCRAWYGGGIFLEDSSAEILNCVITGNDSSWGGGGICCFDTGVRIIGNSIVDNEAYDAGGGIFCYSSSGVVIEGNEIANNVVTEIDYFGAGGGIFYYSSNTLTFTNNVITGNSAYQSGGGLDCTAASAIISGNTFEDNTAPAGGALRLLGSSPTVENNLFVANHADWYGGAIHCRNASPVITGCTMSGNSAETFAGAVYSSSSSAPLITNSILWGNSPDQIHFIDPGMPLVTWSDIQDGWEGEGNFDAAPVFTNGPEGLFYLSQIASGQALDSPCVDSGDPLSELVDGTTRTDQLPDSGIVDLGYHYPCPEAWIRLVTGPGAGYDNPPLVRVYFPVHHGSLEYEFAAYGAPHYGTNVTCGDINGDMVDEILTGPGPGDIYGPNVRGFNSSGTPLPGLNFFAYGTNRFGVNVDAADLDGDGRDEIITGAGPAEVFGPHVRAWIYNGPSGVTPIPGVSFFAYGTPKWGVNVTAGDIDGDGFDEIVTGTGPGAVYGPHVRGWNVDGNPSVSAIPGVSYFAYGTNRFGVNVSCGDVDGDGIDEIVTGAGPGAVFGPHVRGWNYDDNAIAPLPGFSFFAWKTEPLSFGVNVFTGVDLDGDGRDELVAGRGPGPDADTEIKVFTYEGTAVSQWLSLEAFPGLTHGTNVAAGRF